MTGLARVATLAVAALSLGACQVIPQSAEPPQTALPVPEPTPPPPSVTVGATAATTSLGAGPSIASLGLTQADASAALLAFKSSCGWLLSREDKSGLTTPADWSRACGAIDAWPYADAAGFFATHFETVRVADGAAFATGYFEPEIAGSRVYRPGYEVPVYRTPPDLERCWRADIPESERTGRAPLSRRTPGGECVPYYTRAEIEDGALAGRGLEIAWAADAIEFFFLQIQGSGRLTTPTGEVIRIGYANQNGRGYTGIGSVMRERGLLGDGPGQYEGSMQGIVRYLRENPEEGRELMRLNESWVFFQELTGPGPNGSLGIPVTRGNSVAVDPAFVPYGAPVWLDLDRDVADGLWVAQDTGGAIKGANRFDTFWGAGADAREIAGGMSGRGQALLLLPKGTLARLQGR